MDITPKHATPAEPEIERPVRKMTEHLEDALIHLHNSNLPHQYKVELDGLFTWSLQVIDDATSGVKTTPQISDDCARAA